MLVSNITFEQSKQFVTVNAQIRFEDSDHPVFELFVATDAGFHSSFWPDPNALLIAAILPAWRVGERRILVEGSAAICPVLACDIMGALGVLQFWYPELGAPPSIDAAKFAARKPCGSSISLLSCGVDSLATLRQNKLQLPSDHPLAIKSAVPVIFVKDPPENLATDPPSGRLEPARNVVSDLGIDLAPVWTNLWWLVDDGYFFDLKWHGALFAAVASLFSKGYSGAYIASSFERGTLLKPWGSSPLLDPYYSSAHFRLQHHGTGMSRLDKTVLVADWSAGLNNLRVCQNDSTGRTNCGTCEKCIRVMTSLVALGKMGDCTAFPVRDVSSELLETVKEWEMINARWKLEWYTELIPHLSSRGRDDLVGVIGEFSNYFNTSLPGD